jgi:uncharacterized lipoprotein YbaY
MKKYTLLLLGILHSISLTAMGAAPNLILNSGFESKLNSWGKYGTAALSTDRTEGAYSLKVGAGRSEVNQNVITRVVAGKKYLLSVKAKKSSTNVISTMGVRFYGRNGSYLGESKTTITATTFTAYTNLFTVPTGATYAEVFALKETGVSGYVYVDDFALTEEGSTVNNPPTLPAAQTISGNEDGAINFDLNVGSDPDGHSLSYIKVSNPTNGTLTCVGGASRACTFSPNANFNGSTTFTYKVNDGSLDSNTATVTINVASVNDAPTVPSTQTVSTTEDNSITFDINAGSDLDGDALTYLKNTDPASGTLVCAFVTSRSCTFTPDENFSGNVFFTYKAFDGKAESNLATVNISVGAVNDAPTLPTAQTITTSEDNAVTFDLNAGSDTENNSLSYVKVSNSQSGLISCAGGTSRSCTFTPAANFFGSASFTYKVNDGQFDSNIATVTLNVSAVNDAPTVASAQSVTTTEDVAVTFDLNAGSDIENDALTYVKNTNPINGVLNCVGAASRSCTYTPDANFSGVTSFTYVVNDGAANSNLATVSISVTGINHAPTLPILQTIAAVEDTPLTFNVVAGSDTDNDTLNYVKLSNPTSGGLTCDGGAARTCQFTPALNFNGMISFTYKVNDGTIDSNISTVEINVAAVNDAPTLIASQSVSTNEDVAFSFDLNAGSDIENDSLTYVKNTNPASGALTCMAGVSRSCTYTPATGFSGATSFTYKVSDGSLESNLATVTINVVAVNHAPTLPAAQTIATNEDTPITFNVVAGTDTDGDALNYIKLSNPTNGALTCVGGTSRSCTFTPNQNFYGLTSFTYKVNDGSLDSNISTVNINVAAINDAPTIAGAQSVSTNQDVAVNFDLNAGSDVEGSALTYKVSSNPSTGVLSCAGATSRSCSFTPTAGFSGITSFTYKVNDGALDSSAATVSITVIATTNPTPVAEYVPLGVGGGGAMTGIAISPYNNLWFVGTDMGTLFRSTDLGKTWNPVNHFQATFNSDLERALSPGFSADGVTVFHADAGVTPKRSLDSGETFAAINMGLSGDEVIKYWLSDTSNANIMFAGTTKGLLKTSNKGTSWTRISGITEKAIATFIDQNSSTKRIYHATATKILISDNGGTSFTNFYIPSGMQIRHFAGGSDANGLTLSFGDNNGSQACAWVYPYANEWGQGAIDNTVANCGYVWVNKNNGGFVRNNQTYGDHIKMAENNSSTIYTAGGRAWIKQYGTKVHVSKDAGATWTLKLNQVNWDTNPFSYWPQAKIEYSAVALDIGWWDSGYESFAINQKNADVIAGSGFFFMHASMNGGENWLASFTEYKDTGTRAKDKAWKSRGLEVTSVYRMRFHPNNSNLLYAATADIGGSVSEDHGQTFRIAQAAYNSNYDYAFDVNDDMIAYTASGSLHDYPNEWRAGAYAGNGGIYKTLDRGRTWRRLTPDNTTYNRQFLSVGFDSTNRILYGGTQEIGIVRSTDDGATWALYNQGLPAGTKIIPQIEVDPRSGNVYALLTGDYPNFTNQAQTGIYFLDVQNNATSWRLLRGTVNYPTDADAGYKVWYYPTSFAINFSASGHTEMWLTDYENNRNWLMSGIWKTTNGGATWNRVKQMTHATSVIIDQRDPRKVYASGYYALAGDWGNGGQMHTKDGGATWGKNMKLPYQRNARSAMPDPSDPSKMFYSFFGAGMLLGPTP